MDINANSAFYHAQKTPASNALTDLIRAVFRMSANAQKTGTRLTKGLGLTNARWQMLGELHAIEERVTVSQLARHMGLTRQAVQRLADDMARDGLLEFLANPTDARAMHLVLTETGAAVYRHSLEGEWQWTNAVAADFDEAELRAAARLIEAINRKMQEAP